MFHPFLPRLWLQTGRQGRLFFFHDPHVGEFPDLRHYPDLELPSAELTAEVLAAQDAVVIVTDHDSVDYGLVVEHAPLVVDTRNATADLRDGRANVVMA